MRHKQLARLELHGDRARQVLSTCLTPADEEGGASDGGPGGDFYRGALRSEGVYKVWGDGRIVSLSVQVQTYHIRTVPSPYRTVMLCV